MQASKLLAASGGVEKQYIDSLFSAYTYTGNGSTQTITNGIDLAGKGGLVWTKGRSGITQHGLYDTTRGATKYIMPNEVSAETTRADGITAFTSTGYSLGADAATESTNKNATTYVSWTFRKAERFFDVVTYTGDGTTNKTISHSLGSTPGMIIVKDTSGTSDWCVYHRSATTHYNGLLQLNTTAAYDQSTNIGIWGTALDVNASTFNVGKGAAGGGTASTNINGRAYVAYLFAHDTSTDGLIQCGSFTTDGSGNATVTLGWEPQYLQFKKSSGTADNWNVLDNARGWSETEDNFIKPNTSGAEVASSSWGTPKGTGFTIGSASASATYIYLAIRRPNKPPTTGTQVYNAIARTGTGAAATVTGVGFAPDLVAETYRTPSAGTSTGFFDRLRGKPAYLLSAFTQAENTSTTDSLTSFNMDGISVGADATYGGINTNTYSYINHFFKRAPGVFDVVCDTGTGAAHTVSHSLGAVPELMIRKKRSAVDAWYVYAGDATDYLVLNTTAATVDLDTIWNDTAPTSTVFTVGTHDDVNANAATFVTYLFATLAGISKVGSYTGNGSSQTLNCGFTTGARFILIKRTDSAGDWYVWDTTRGIVAGNDPHLSLNTTATEVTTDDSIDPDTSGFIVNQLAATNINVTSATYIFLALA